LKKLIKFSLLLTLGLMFSFNAMAKQYSVIVNSGNDFAGDAKNFYLLNQGFGHWPNGTVVTPYDLKTAKDLKLVIVRVAFIKSFLKMSSASDLDHHWISRKSKGFTRKAEKKSDFSSILTFVKREKGGIGFVPRDMAKGVNVLATFEVK